MAKTTKQQHKKKKSFFFPPRQISFAITALVINFSGNFYTWLVSLGGVIISLPPLQIRRVVTVNSGAQLAEVKKELLVLCESKESQLRLCFYTMELTCSCTLLAQHTFLESALQKWSILLSFCFCSVTLVTWNHLNSTQSDWTTYTILYRLLLFFVKVVWTQQLVKWSFQ